MPTKPKFVFFGSPEFAVIILETLVAADLLPTVVVCNPDRPVGRKKIVTAPLIKQFIEKRKLPIEILQPEKPKEIADRLKKINPDFAVVAAYSQILKNDILSIPRLGTIGVHPSLLPKYRGATPIQSAILNGETETGVALYQMGTGVDDGPILAIQQLKIGNKNYKELESALAKLGGELLATVIPKILTGAVTAKPQNNALATLTKKFETEDGFIDTAKDSLETIQRKIRALNPEPGVWTLKNGERIKILDEKTIQYAGKKPQSVPDAIAFLYL